MKNSQFVSETLCRLRMGSIFVLGIALIVRALGTSYGIPVCLGALLVILQWTLGDFFALARAIGATPHLPALWILINGAFLCACRGIWWASFDAWICGLQLALYLGFCAFIAYALKRSRTSLLDISSAIFGVLYLAVPLASLMLLMVSCGSDFALRQWWAIYAVGVAKVTDIGAWYIGSRWGRRPLGPISPRKTLEGFWGGIATGVLAGTLLTWYHPHMENAKVSVILASAPYHFIVSSVAQLGDLFESLLKRAGNLRHSGHLPGLGGILDLIDSLLLTFPLLYLARCI